MVGAPAIATAILASLPSLLYTALAAALALASF